MIYLLSQIYYLLEYKNFGETGSYLYFSRKNIRRLNNVLTEHCSLNHDLNLIGVSDTFHCDNCGGVERV